MNVYEGGLNQGEAKLYPRSDSEGEYSGTYGGEMAMKAAKGGPASNGGYTTKDFLDDKSYRPRDMEVGRPGAMKVVGGVSNSGGSNSGNSKGMSY